MRAYGSVRACSALWWISSDWGDVVQRADGVGLSQRACDKTTDAQQHVAELDYSSLRSACQKPLRRNEHSDQEYWVRSLDNSTVGMVQQHEVFTVCDQAQPPHTTGFDSLMFSGADAYNGGFAEIFDNQA